MREKLKAGETVIGSWVNTGSPVVAELMGQAGFDFLAVDMEHSAVNLPEVESLFRAIRAGSRCCTPGVRMASSDYYETRRLVDAGAELVICPLVKNREQALGLVDAVMYPPDGRRGVGFCRDNSYGVELATRFNTANNTKVICVQIEDIYAVENIDSILTVKGIDAAFIGPYDLSASMGIAGQFDHPDYISAKKSVLSACSKHGVAAGIHVIHPDPEQVRKAIREGYRLIAYSLDITILTDMCREGVSKIRQIIEDID